MVSRTIYPKNILSPLQGSAYPVGPPGAYAPGSILLRRFAAHHHSTRAPLANSGLTLETISACLSLFLSLARLHSLPAVHAALVRLRSDCLCKRGRAFCS